MRRVAFPLTTVGLSSVATMSSAAAGPVREPLPLPPRIVLDGVCPDLDIIADILVNTEYALTFSDADGDPVRSITTGRHVVRLTNPESGASVVRNISGPGETVFHADGSTTPTARGTWFLFFTDGQLLPSGEPTSFINRGLTVVETDANGVATIPVQRGALEGLCVTLA